MLVARSTVSRIIDQMEIDKLVHRVTDPDDRRAQRVVLTAAGVDFAARVHEFARQGAGRLPVWICLTEQAELLLLLRKMRSGLAANVGDGK